jgi:hypothetical protein
MRITEKQIRQIIREEILRETEQAPTLGADVKGGSAATAAEKKLDSNAALKPVLDKVSNVNDAKAVLQHFLEMLTKKGIDKTELKTALKAMLNPKP